MRHITVCNKITNSLPAAVVPFGLVTETSEPAAFAAVLLDLLDPAVRSVQ